MLKLDDGALTILFGRDTGEYIFDLEFPLLLAAYLYLDSDDFFYYAIVVNYGGFFNSSSTIFDTICVEEPIYRLIILYLAEIPRMNFVSLILPSTNISIVLSSMGKASGMEFVV